MQPRGLPKITVFPKTTLGKWSAVCALAFILVMSLFFWLASSQALRGVSIGIDPRMLSRILKGLLAVIAAGALISGVISMIKNQERSVTTFTTIAVGFFGLIGALS
jgi:hypothetical protein